MLSIVEPKGRGVGVGVGVGVWAWLWPRPIGSPQGSLPRPEPLPLPLLPKPRDDPRREDILQMICWSLSWKERSTAVCISFPRCFVYYSTTTKDEGAEGSFHVDHSASSTATQHMQSASSIYRLGRGFIRGSQPALPPSIGCRRTVTCNSIRTWNNGRRDEAPAVEAASDGLPRQVRGPLRAGCELSHRLHENRLESKWSCNWRG